MKHRQKVDHISTPGREESLKNAGKVSIIPRVKIFPVDGREGLYKAKVVNEAETHIQPKTTGPDADLEACLLDIIAYRRFLNDDQRAVLAALWKERQKISYRTAQRAKELFNITRKKLEQATTLLNRSPELAIKILNGSIRLSQAYRKV